MNKPYGKRTGSVNPNTEESPEISDFGSDEPLLLLRNLVQRAFPTGELTYEAIATMVGGAVLPPDDREVSVEVAAFLCSKTKQCIYDNLEKHSVMVREWSGNTYVSGAAIKAACPLKPYKRKPRGGARKKKS